MFIAFEGGEGSGKSTVCLNISLRLLRDGYLTLVTREPGGSPLAENIRLFIFDHDMDSITEAFLFAAARREHVVNTIVPAIEQGKIVLSDRYLDSSLVYLGSARNLTPELVKSINIPAVTYTDFHGYLKLCYPDLTFFLDINPEDGLLRVAARNSDTNRFDKELIVFHKRVHDAYINLTKDTTFKRVVIDASKSIEDVTSEVYNYISKYLRGDNES